MERLWDLPHGWPACWKRFLFTATVLSYSIQLASSAQLSIAPMPSYGSVGSNVTLSVFGVPKEPQSYSWFRHMMQESSRIVSYAVQSGEQSRGLNYTGRESILPNGSLFISNLTSNDGGVYIIQVTIPDLKPILGRGRLQVNDSPKASHFGLVANIVLGALASGVVMSVLGYFLFKQTQGSSKNMRKDSVRRQRSHLINQNTGREDILYENCQWHQGMVLTVQEIENPESLNNLPDATQAVKEGGGLSSISSPEILEAPHQTLDISKMDTFDEVMVWPTVQAL